MSNVLAQDTFARANQTGWGTASDGNTWSQVRGSMPWAITSNKGTCNSASGGTFNIFRLSSQSPTTQEILVRVIPSDTSDIGCVGRYNSTTQFYYGVLTGGNTLAIGRDNSGFSTLASASFTYSAGSAYWLRFRLVGTSLKLRGWADGSSEPSTWNVTTTDSTFSSGGFGLGSDSSSATNTQFDQFSATDASTQLSTPVRTVVRTQVTKSLPVRVLVRTQQTKSLPIRALVRTQKTVSAPIRSVIRTLKTLSLPIRSLIRTQITDSLPIRTVVTGSTAKKISLRIRTLVRTFNTKSLPMRTVVRTQVTKSLPVRSLIRTLKILSTQVRTVVRTLKSISLAVRTVVGTRVTKSVPVRIVVRTLRTLSTPLRSVIRTLKTVSLPIRTGVRTQVTKSLPVRSVVRGRTLSVQIRTVVSSPPLVIPPIHISWITGDMAIAWTTED